MEISILKQKPSADEYSGHYSHYLDLIEEGNIVEIFEKNSAIAQDFFNTIDENLGDHTYAFGKWTIKDILGHLIDTERIFSTRAMRIVRGDKQPLTGFEQDDYVKNGNFFKRKLSDLLEERLMLRGANLKLFRSFEEDDFMKRGIVNENEITVRAILHLLVGHEIYHMKFLKENYL